MKLPLPITPPLRRALGRASRAAAATAAAALLLCAGAQAAEPKPGPVKDPHYGDTLFYFFQGRYFSAITNLMVSQHFERLPDSIDEAELLRGGMLLSYGLHREAGEIFEHLLDKQTSPSVRDRAWFYVAKIRYQRGYLTEAQEAVDRIGKTLPADLAEEQLLLKAQLQMAREDYAGAIATLQAMPKEARSARYARFNLGIAQIRGQDAARGEALLHEIGQAPAESEEYRSLRDKANVALGYAALQNERPDEARKALERVRLKSLHANKALLGFGWAAAANKQFKQALIPWLELAQRDPTDAAALESHIAVAYAYAELGLDGQALDSYTEAIRAYEREGRALDESIAAIRAGKLLNGLLTANPGEEMGWFWNIEKLPELPHASHLTQVLAQHEFQEAFKNYRDLRFLAQNLAEWQDKLGVFTDMLDTRRQAFAERLPKVRSQAAGLGLETLFQRTEALTQELARVEAHADANAFASATEQRQRAVLNELREGLHALGQDADSQALRERYRLVSGALTWQLAQQYPDRLWEAEKAIKVASTELAQARRRDASLAQAQQDEPVRHERFAQRIAELDKRIAALTPRVAALSTEQQQQVQDLAVAELNRQKERLAIYTTQARFALAQLYDRANQPKEAGDATKP